MKKLIFISLIAISFFTSCKNEDNEFADYKYTTVYFPYQYPVRTIVLGKDLYDNSLDLAHKCKIMATMGGVYSNNSDRILDVEVDNSMFDTLLFDGEAGKYILPMPSNYYTLPSNMQIVIPAGSISGGIEVQLTDAFFADKKSTQATYVIPLRIKSVKNADSILSGKAAVTNPNLFVASDWSIAPKNYILYCIKYINPWHGAYLRRGVDVGKGSAGYSKYDTVLTYHKQYVERDTIAKMYTVSMNECLMTVKTRNARSKKDVTFSLIIKVDDAGKCVVSAPDTVSYKISGTGEFVKDGDMWGGVKQDVMRLKYSVDFDTITHTLTDTLVMRDRQVVMQTFTPAILKK